MLLAIDVGNSNIVLGVFDKTALLQSWRLQTLRERSSDALFQRAARLPRIEVRKPATVVGRTTVGAMEAGLFYGYVGMVEGLVRRMNDELGGNAVCVATGGLATLIAPETRLIEHVDVDLTLHGLRIVWQRNHSETTRDYND